MNFILQTVWLVSLSIAASGEIGNLEDWTNKADEILVVFGYLPEPAKGTAALRSNKALSSALKEYQTYAGLDPSGIVDKATIAKFKEPRCGMKDEKTLKRGKRYVHQGTAWKKRDLTYTIINYSSQTSRLSSNDIRRVVWRTLSKWSMHTNINFREVRPSSNADIRIRFVRGSHNDPYPFDGRGGTLAHAFYPGDNRGLSGDAHFDDDEYFTLRSPEGTNFYWVALHEFGHSIGLEHSRQKGAVMYPWYQGYKGDDVSLTRDDILGIQALYGVRNKKPAVKPVVNPAKKPTSAPVTTKPKPKPKREFCINKIKAAFFGNDMKTWVINDDKLYILGKSLKVEKGPTPIGDVFKGVTKVDAALQTEGEEVILFHGDKFWMFNNIGSASGPRLRYGPYHITQFGLKKEMQNLDAAVTWKGSGKQYFFKGDQFWRLDAGTRRMDPGYPKPISRWGGIPSNLDAVVQWRNKALYFFKGGKFYRYDTRRISVVRGYPRSIVGHFVVCPSGGATVGKFSSSDMVFVDKSMATCKMVNSMTVIALISSILLALLR